MRTSDTSGVTPSAVSGGGEQLSTLTVAGGAAAASQVTGSVLAGGVGVEAVTEGLVSCGFWAFLSWRWVAGHRCNVLDRR